MKICDNFDHEDIVYDVKECPLCQALEQIKELEDENKGAIQLLYGLKVKESSLIPKDEIWISKKHES